MFNYSPSIIAPMIVVLYQIGQMVYRDVNQSSILPAPMMIIH